MDIKWKLREYATGDEQGIIELRKVVFAGEELNKQELEFWNWEFRDNNAGHAKMYLADDNGEIVGHYAIVPQKYLVDNKEVTGSIVVDVMTHPDYRMQGMFAKLGKYSLERAGMNELAFSVGFPVRDEVMPGHYKVGWKLVTKIPVLAVPLNFENASKKVVDLPILNKLINWLGKPFYNILLNKFTKVLIGETVTVGRLDRFDGVFDEFWERIKVQYKTVQVRDSSFLNWRFCGNRFLKYDLFKAETGNEIKGFIALRETEIYGLTCLVIVDIHVLSFEKEIIDALLKKAYELAVVKNVDLIGCMITNNNPYYDRMMKLGFMKTPHHFKLITHINNSQITEAALNAPTNLFYTWADTDVM